MSPERLNKALAAAGVASRRDCDELIAAGRVSINGRVVRELGSRVDLDTDEVLVDGQPLQRVDQRVYMLLHKPVGVVSTADDPQGRPTVVGMVPDDVRVFPVGRLDTNSEGLILLTNDGELTHTLTHPSFEVEKEYRVLLDAAPDSDTLREWRQGVLLDGERTAPAWVDVQEHTEQGVWVRVVLREGRKRQIREVAKLLGYEVLRLIRVREGNLLLGDLPVGAWRFLTEEEIAVLKAHTLPPEPRDRSRMFSERERPPAPDDGFAAGDSRPPRRSDPSSERPPRRTSTERGYRGESQSDRRPPNSRGEPRYRGESQSDRRPPSSRGEPRYRGESQSDRRPPSSRGKPRYRGDEYPPRDAQERPRHPRSDDSRPERPPRDGDEQPRRPRSGGGGNRAQHPRRDAGGREQQGGERREGNRAPRTTGDRHNRSGKPGMKPTRRPNSKPTGNTGSKPASRRERHPNEDGE